MDKRLIEDFLLDSKGLVIAPAGYGKTYAIAECVLFCPDSQCQLILTHTHAGIASIRAKLMELGVDPMKYHIATISGFAQRYVLAFSSVDSLPDQGDKDYFDIIIEKAIVLFNFISIKSIILNSYKGLFVDEYQDCTIAQHSFLMEIASVLPTHIFGDPLQGIFGFNGGSLVDFNTCLSSFHRYPILKTPWRWWSKDNCKELGDAIAEYRTVLENQPPSIKLINDEKSHFYTYCCNFDINSFNYDILYNLSSKISKRYPKQSLLIIIPNHDEKGVPITATMRSKIRLRFDFEKRFSLIEAIDDQSFYSIARRCDDIIIKVITARNKYDLILDLLEHLSFSKTHLKKYIVNNKIVNKKDPSEKVLANKLREDCEQLFTFHNYFSLLEIIKLLHVQYHFPVQRFELLYTTMVCVEKAIYNNSKVIDEMREYKNIIRQIGRKTYQFSLGTTLLTKGLEYDNVIILGVNLINDYNNLYVAISRASKRLFLITNNQTIIFR